VAGTLGLMSKHDVLAAVLAAVAGVFVRGAQEAGGATRPASPGSETDLY
jgi:hypothetical protein